MIESEGGIDYRPTFASYGARLLGLIVDTVVLTLLVLPGVLMVIFGSTAVIVLGMILITAGFCAATAIYALGVSKTGQSLGNRVCSTTVVDVRTGKFVSTGDAGLRFVLRQTSSMVLFIGFLAALGSAQRRTLHDNAAGTIVTRPSRASWSIQDETPDGDTA